MDTQGTPTHTFTPGLSECVALHGGTNKIQGHQEKMG